MRDLGLGGDRREEDRSIIHGLCSGFTHFLLHFYLSALYGGGLDLVGNPAGVNVRFESEWMVSVNHFMELKVCE